MKKVIAKTPIIIILIVFFSCKPKINETKVEVVKSDLNRVWMLIEFQDFKKDELIASKASLNLTEKEIANANMGCNGISFQINLKSATEISFTNGIRTEMACADMRLEDAFLKVLPTITHFKIKGHSLELYTSEKQKMVFIAQDWD